MRSAVVYYSRSGLTKQIANAISFKFESDIYVIDPREDYGSFFSAIYKVAREKQKKQRQKPKPSMADYSKYDTIFLGFPVWAGTMPEFLQLYVRKADWKGKRVIPFVTAAGTGRESALACVEKLLPDSEVSDYYYSSLVKKMDAEKWMEEIQEKYC